MNSNTPANNTRDESRELSDADLEGVTAGKGWPGANNVGFGITPTGRVGLIGSPYGYGVGYGGFGRGYGWW